MNATIKKTKIRIFFLSLNIMDRGSRYVYDITNITNISQVTVNPRHSLALPAGPGLQQLKLTTRGTLL